MASRSTYLSSNNLSFFGNNSSFNQQNPIPTYQNENIQQKYMFTTDAIEFYKQLYDLKALQKVEIVNYEINPKRGYTTYQLTVDTIYLSFQIWKRYSDFHKWFSKIENLLDRRIVEIFPQKSFFKNNMNPNFVQSRMDGLNQFLSTITSNSQNLLFSFAFLDFLEIRRQYIIHQIKLTKDIQDTSTVNKMNLDEGQIIQYIERLNNEKELLTHVFIDIQGFFAKMKPKLTQDSVNTLLLGCKQYQGLIATLGGLTQRELGSHQVCSTGFKLLYSLFDYEHNRDADTFIKSFCSLPIKIISNLKLSFHIVCQSMTICKQFSLKILDIYIQKNSIRSDEQLLALVNKQQSYLNKLQGDQNALLQYKNWVTAKVPRQNVMQRQSSLFMSRQYQEEEKKS